MQWSIFKVHLTDYSAYVETTSTTSYKKIINSFSNGGMKNFNLELKIHLDSFKSRRAATTWSVFASNYTIHIHWIELNSHITFHIYDVKM